MTNENDIKVAAQINKKLNLRSEGYLQDHLKDLLHVPFVDDYQIFF